MPITSNLLNRVSQHVATGELQMERENQSFYTYLLRTTSALMAKAASKRVLQVNANSYKIGANYQILSFTTLDFMDALKYFAYVSYVLETQHTPNIPLDIVRGWQIKCIEVFSSLKINVAKQVNALGRVVIRPPTKLAMPSYEIVYDLTKEIRDIIYPKKSKVLGDPGATADLRNFLGNVFTYFNKKSQSSYKGIATKIRLLNEPKLSSILRVPNDSNITSEPVKAYQAWIATKTKRKNPEYLTKAEGQKLSPADLAKHKELSKAETLAFKNKLSEIVKNSQEQHLPVDDVRSNMAAEGFSTWRFPTGVKLRVDEAGGLYTIKGDKLKMGLSGGKYVPNPSFSHKNPHAEFYAKGKPIHADPNTKDMHVYTEGHDKIKEAKKAAQKDELEEKIDGMQVKWRKDLMQGKNEKKMLGAMLEVMFHVSNRIGGEGNMTDGKKTYGLTTLLVKHFKLAQNGDLIITYPGKSGMINRHVIPASDPIKKALISYVMSLTNNKERTDKIWDNGKGVAMNANDLRNYSKSLGYGGSVHKIRHVKADRLFRRLMEQKRLPKNADAKKVKMYHDWISTEVGKLLNHQRTKTDPVTGKQTTVSVGNTASQSYISPSLQKALWRDRGLPIPKAIENLKDV